jgi:hypothetical protein
MMMKRVRCSQCKRLSAPWDLVHIAFNEGEKYKPFCVDCSNRMMAERSGLEDFQTVPFESMELTDADGVKHWFHFRTRLFGPGIALDAFEFPDAWGGGYRFQVIGEPHDDQMQLFARLLEKMRRALAQKHLAAGTNGWRIADHKIMRGRIGSEKQGRNWMPIVVVDGRALPWDMFGQMLLTHEGFQFKLEVRDMADEM